MEDKNCANVDFIGPGLCRLSSRYDDVRLGRGNVSIWEKRRKCWSASMNIGVYVMYLCLSGRV